MTKGQVQACAEAYNRALAPAEAFGLGLGWREGGVGSAIITLDEKACEGLVWLYVMHR